MGSGPVPWFRYVPALDGVRAVAIGAVLAFHADEPVVRGGWVGVDLFLVLSGFLITTILVQEFRTTGAVDLRRFYARRFLRLSPALFTLILGLGLASFVVSDRLPAVLGGGSRRDHPRGGRPRPPGAPALGAS